MKKGILVHVYKWNTDYENMSPRKPRSDYIGDFVTEIFVPIAKIKRRDERRYPHTMRGIGMQIAREMFAANNNLDFNQMGRYFCFERVSESF